MVGDPGWTRHPCVRIHVGVEEIGREAREKRSRDRNEINGIAQVRKLTTASPSWTHFELLRFARHRRFVWPSSRFKHLRSDEVSLRQRAPSLAFWYYGVMATRKMTFSVPEPLAAQFLLRVASRDRSRFVTDALASRLEERDAALIRACDLANQDMDVAEIEREFDGLGDEMAEPWR
jgi:hypothetical protein